MGVGWCRMVESVGGWRNVKFVRLGVCYCPHRRVPQSAMEIGGKLGLKEGERKHEKGGRY